MNAQKDNGRVYTKSTPLLIEEWRKFNGKKETIVGDENNPENYFSNFNYMGDTGYFSLDLPITGSSLAYQEWGAREVSEQEFLDIVLERPTKSKDDSADLESAVNSPSHYTDGKIEVIDFIEDKKLGFHLGNAIKYISRAGKKDPTKTKQDLNKAIWYINRYTNIYLKDDEG